jgi:hypothetical protein
LRGNLTKYCALAFGAIALMASAQAQAPALRPLGVGLEDIEYPYPVHYLDLTIEGQLLRMAYMDVAPAGVANGKTVVLFHGKSFAADYWARNRKTYGRWISRRRARPAWLRQICEAGHSL